MTTLRKEIAWGKLIAFAIFFGGLGGGSFIITTITSFVAPDLKEVMIYGSIIGVVSAVLCVLFFALEVGHPERFLRLFLNFPSSMISFGTSVLVLIILLGLFYTTFYLPELFPSLKPILPWYINIGLRQALGVIMLILGFCLVGYTAFVLGAARANAFWETPLLPILFLASGISTALATIGLTLTIFNSDKIGMIHMIDVTDLYMLILEFGIVLSFVYSMLFKPKEEAVIAARALTRGSLKMWFWFGFIGIGLLIPAVIIGLLEFVGFNRPLVMVAMSSVIIGGLVMRYLIVTAGQLPLLEKEAREYARYGLL